MVQKVRNWFQNLNMRARYVLLLYSALLLLFLLLAFVLIFIAGRNARQEALNSAAKSASYSNLIVEREQQHLYGIASYYAITEEVQDLICASNSGAASSRLPQTLLDVSQRRSDLLSLVFYNHSGDVIDYFSIDGSYGAVNQDTADKSRPFWALMDGRASYLWEYIPARDTVYMSHDNSPKFCLWHVVRDSGTQSPIGAIAVTIDARKLFPDSYRSLNLNDNLLILDTNKRQAFGRTELAKNVTMDEIDALAGHVRQYENTGDFSARIGGKRYFGAFSKIPHTDLVSFALMEERPFPEGVSTVFATALSGILLICVFTLSILMFLTKFLMRPLSQLAETMERFRNGDLDTEVQPQYHDEIGRLGALFNKMVQDQRRLIEERYLLTIRTREAELTKMQAQINPHFIYNTLNAIQWTAIDKDEPEIAEMAYSVGQVFRLSLSGGQDFIPISIERDLICFYLSLQEKRFENRISYSLHFAPETLPIAIPKLLIQPLVENSSIHGVTSASSHVHITVEVTQPLAGRVHIQVADDGAGIPPEILRLLPDRLDKASSESASHSHFALKNIAKRLELYYGGGYTFEIRSTLGHGTTVIIDIPVSSTDAKKL